MTFNFNRPTQRIQDMDLAREQRVRMQISPEDAEWLLTLNTSNRRVRDTKVEEYKHAMLSGQWIYNGDAIRISRTRTLLDGQHRLYAAALSGVSLDIDVVTGLPDDAQSTMDVGLKRTTGDTLGLAGIPSGNSVAAAVRWAMNIASNVAGKGTIRSISTADVLDFLKEDDRILSLSRDYLAKYQGGPVTASLAIALHYCFEKVDEDQAASFMRDFFVGAALAEDDPVFILRRRFEKANRYGRGLKRNAKREDVALIIRAWNARREGGARTTLRGTVTSPTTQESIFPKIK